MINLLVSWLITTILSGMAIIVAINLIRESPDYLRSFLTAFLANVASFFVLSYLFLPIPYSSIVLGAITWILVIKVIFRFNWAHSFVVGILGYAIKVALDILNISGWIMVILGL